MTVPKRVVFAGLARDCGHALPAILRSMAEFGENLQDWGYIFLENDSVDDTAALLSTFDAQHQRGIVRSISNSPETKIDLRTERLAALRNRCLDEIFSDARLGQFDHLIIMDLDAVNEYFDASRLLELLDTEDPDWTAIFANQSERYYDIWALRHPDWSPDDCWKRVRERPESMSKEEAIAKFVASRRVKLDLQEGFIEVQSAFGGLGLYKLQALRDCQYVGVDEDGSEICEHVAFHRCLTEKGGKLYVDPLLINGRGDHRHNAGMSLVTKAKRKLNKLLTRKTKEV
ncbi:MAG: hypothetical protein P1V21_23355 [Rhizobiaceae bacterium]|nr:hypothetical protein [Rhizobiaceae bacterium]